MTDSLDLLRAENERLRLEQDQRQEAARVALHEALAAFQAECPIIKKPRTSGGANAKGTSARYSYTYAALDDIMRVIRPLLHKYGLSVTYSQDTDGERMTVTCHVHHVAGATLSSPWVGPAADAGSMNAIQKVGSATSYARRYALVNALDIVVSDEDDDGVASEREDRTITDAMADELEKLIERAGSEPASVLEHYDVGSFAELKPSQYTLVRAAMENRINRKETQTDG